MAANAAPGGAIDEQRVGRWLAEHVPGARPPFRYELIVGGRSNLTYQAIDGAGNRFVLRRPPLGEILATAHDVVREYRITAALATTPVPVAPALAVCDDASVNGAPFAVTGFVDGVVLDDAAKGAAFGTEELAALSWHLIDVLADLHSVDVERVGLADLSRHEGYIERQLRRWAKQWTGSRTRELPVIDEVEARLRSAVPPQRTTTLVHGDYRFGNCIVDPEAHRVAAVLDWELCTLGDPLADLGHLSVYWHDDVRPLALTNDPTASGRFPELADLLGRYAARTGADLSGIEYYRAFAAWRLAIIGEGVADRHRMHHPEDVAALHVSQLAVERLALSALDALSQQG